MSTILPLVVLLVLAIPVAIVIGLFTLSGRVKDLAAQLDTLRIRLAQAEGELRRWKESAAQSPSTHPTTATISQAEVPPASSSPASLPPPALPDRAAPPPLAAVPPTIAPALPSLSGTLPTSLVQALRSDAPAEPPPPAFPMEPEPGLTTGYAASRRELPPLAQPKAPLAINWEQFMGVKMFAWLGGFALFLGVSFFIKYSFERNLIPPEMRAAIGFIVGLGLVAGGVLMKRRQLAVTSQTLCATGVVILYAVTFACRSIYHFGWFGALPTFLLMALITAGAFTLAVRLEAQVVAILGLVGGFLTPFLLSSGQDNPAGLFSYIALLDLGLIAVAFRRRWAFLILMGAIGTMLMEVSWVGAFFGPSKLFVAMAIFLGFDALFLLAFWAGEKWEQPNDWLTASAVALPFVTLGFVFCLLGAQSYGLRPGVLFTFMWAADLCLLALVLMRESLQRLHPIAGAVVFLLLGTWTARWVEASLLNWALGLYLIFATLHAMFPILLARARAGTTQMWWGQFFPPLALLLILIPLFNQETISFAVWPAVLLLDALAIGLAILAGSVVAITLVLLLTLVATGVWLLKLPADLDVLPPLLFVIGGFAVFFFFVGQWAGKKILTRLSQADVAAQGGEDPFAAMFGITLPAGQGVGQVPALSAILPFLLLMMATGRLPLDNPSPVFGLGMVLVALLVGLALVVRMGALVPVSLGCVLASEQVWHSSHFNPANPWIPLIWYLAFYGVYTLVPFLLRRRVQSMILPWASAALAGPLQFFFVYQVMSHAFPNPYMGLLPAAFSIPALLAVWHLVRTIPPDSPMRLGLLAWFGASALFFITLIFPIQFERQWITLGWALEGVALIWLFHRVPHPGLRATGVVLLSIAFARLALNPAVFEYHRNSETRVFNWFLYAYGIVTICLLLGARLLAPPRHLVWKKNIPPYLDTLGTILAFLLLNIEIADYFSEGVTLTFQFSGNFARDMCYSVGWALFGLTLLGVGIWKRLPAVRYAAIGLLGVTLLKLFVHDLSELQQLYRIAAFIIVAVILILASFLYQRFVSFEAKRAS